MRLGRQSLRNQTMSKLQPPCGKEAVSEGHSYYRNAGLPQTCGIQDSSTADKQAKKAPGNQAIPRSTEAR